MRQDSDCDCTYAEIPLMLASYPGPFTLQHLLYLAYGKHAMN